MHTVVVLDEVQTRLEGFYCVSAPYRYFQAAGARELRSSRPKVMLPEVILGGMTQDLGRHDNEFRATSLRLRAT